MVFAVIVSFFSCIAFSCGFRWGRRMALKNYRGVYSGVQSLLKACDRRSYQTQHLRYIPVAAPIGTQPADATTAVTGELVV